MLSPFERHPLSRVFPSLYEIRRNAANVAVIAAVIAVAVSVSTGVSVSRSQSSIAPETPMVCPENPVNKKGSAIIEFEGFERTLIDSEKKILEDAFTTAYNDVSAGCYDIYQRTVNVSEIVSQIRIFDEFGSPILVTEFVATMKCRDCSDREPLFGHNDDVWADYWKPTTPIEFCKPLKPPQTGRCLVKCQTLCTSTSRLQ